MPPMPPGGMPGADFGSGRSPTIASVVISKPATEAASCNATRTTLVGSMIPARDHVLVLAGLCVKAEIRVVLVGQPADDDRALTPGILRDLAHRRLDRLAHNVDTDLLVVVGRVERG